MCAVIVSVESLTINHVTFISSIYSHCLCLLQVKVGDCFRLGSVGLVVSEMRADGEVEQRIDAKTLEFLKDEALAFDTNGDLATLAADEERLGEYLSNCCVVICCCFCGVLLKMLLSYFIIFPAHGNVQ